ncbi:hypothetical protein GCM10027416_05650 [Okibacterium endophyticum]
MGTEVRREPEMHRYSLFLDGENVGITEYQEHGDTIVFPHTLIEPPHRGQGLGELLVRGALDDVRSRSSAAVVPACSFVNEFIRTHPEYNDLLTARPD